MWTALLVLSLTLSTQWQQSYAQDTATAIEGISSNLQLPCPSVVFRPLEMSGVQIFWKINKTPYRINEVPSPFDVTTDEFALVLTGLAHRAYDGYTVQCIGIEWGADGTPTREFLGLVTTLVVMFTPEDFVRLDYQHLTITSTSVEIHVLPHSSASCRTIPFTVETYDLDQLSGDAFDISRVLSRVPHASGDSNTFLVPRENTANGEGFLFRVTANVCATDETSYYQLQPNNIPALFPADADAPACLTLPLDMLSSGESLEMVWPKKLGSTGDCSCPPFEGTQMQFTDCAENCNTEYSISIVNNTLACFVSLTPEQNHTPVYFIVVRAVPCLVEDGTTKQCYIRKIARSYNIIVTETPDSTTSIHPTTDDSTDYTTDDSTDDTNDDSPECFRAVCRTGAASAFGEPAVLIVIIALLFLLVAQTLVMVFICFACHYRRRRGCVMLSDHNLYTNKQRSNEEREHSSLAPSLSAASYSLDTKQSPKEEVITVPSDYCTPIDALREAFPDGDPNRVRRGKRGAKKEVGEPSRAGLPGEAKKVVKRAKSFNTVVDQVTYDEPAPVTALSYKSLEKKDDAVYENIVTRPQKTTPVNGRAKPSAKPTSGMATPISSKPTSTSSGAASRRETVPGGPARDEAASRPRGKRVASVDEGVSTRPLHSSQVPTNRSDLSELYQNMAEMK